PRELYRLQVETLDARDGGAAALAALCEWIGVSPAPEMIGTLSEDADWAFAGHGPRAAPQGLDAEVLAALPRSDRERAARPALDLPLPWRPDEIGFDVSVIRCAQRYGYA